MTKKYKAYHIDRLGLLKPNDLIELQLVNNINPEYLNEMLNIKYPLGLSNHGKTYCSCLNTEKNKNSYLIETFVEYERLLNFPNKFSRFQSFFAAETLEECIYWNNILNPDNQFSVWEIEFEHDNFLKLDASWLKGDVSKQFFLYYSDFACKYWSGAVSEKPSLELLIKPPIRIVRKVQL